MKLIIVLLTTAILQVSASTYGQKITLKQTNASLVSLFTEIRKQTGYDFFYSDKMIDSAKPISIDLKNATIAEALKQIFAKQPLEYEVKANSVLIRPKEPSFLDRLAERWASIDVRGRVVDAETGQALAGASVKVKGTNRQTNTNAQGDFYLRGLDEDAVIEVSFVGYLSKELKAEKEMGTIKLTMGNSELDAVQVIAYGTTTRRLSTSNIGSVKAGVIEKQPVTNPILALQGRVPGLVITQQNGVPGGNVSVMIQGKGSLASGTDPFYVIDGVPYTSKLFNAPNSVNVMGSGGGSPLSFINPSDIEQIEVLKDADATSIYGSRAANGAILITTKKGLSGKTQVAFDFQAGWGKVARKIEMMKTREYMEMRREAKRNDNLPVSATDYDLNGVWDTTRNTDWQKEALGKTTHYINARVSVSGGSEGTQYFIAVGYLKETAAFLGDYSDTKGSVNFNLQHQSPDKKFKLQFSTTALDDVNKLPLTDFTSIALSLAPNAPPIFKSDGTINWAQLPNGSTTFLNPFSAILQSYTAKTLNINSSIVPIYEIIPGLAVSTNLGLNRLSTTERTKTPLAFYDPNAVFRPRQASFGDRLIQSIIVEPQISYRRKFNFGTLDFLLGSTYLQTRSESRVTTGSNFNSDVELDNLMASPNISMESSAQNKYRYNALFGRLNYNYGNKYILNLTARRDGSSRFGSENQFANFYSAGVAWIFTGESFMKNFMSFLNFGKLRASYGTTGNDQIEDYLYLNLYGPYTSGITAPYQGVTSAQATRHANPYLQWELTKKFNLGLDMGFLSNRILLGLNYYINSSSNQLVNAPMSIQTGFGIIRRNLQAVIRNSGPELSLSAKPVLTKDFSWSSSFNITVPKNKLVSYPDLANSGYNGQFLVGESINIALLYKMSGVNASTGIYEFYNSKGEVVASPNALTDRTEVVDLSPKFYGGWQNALSYKGVELDFIFSFGEQRSANSFLQVGNQIAGYISLNQPVTVRDRWKQQGDDRPFQKANSNFSIFTPYNLATGSDRAYTNVSYICLKNVSLSYSLPAALLTKCHIGALRLFVQGQNLYYFSKFKGLNPESANATLLPPLRMITTGLRLNL